jgi:hypothetical protein
MDGGNGVIAMIVEEYGDAVCCLDGKTQAGDIGEDGIGVVGTAGGGNTTDIGGVSLAGKGQRLAKAKGTAVVELFSLACGAGREPRGGVVDEH